MPKNAGIVCSVQDKEKPNLILMCLVYRKKFSCYATLKICAEAYCRILDKHCFFFIGSLIDVPSGELTNIEVKGRTLE